MGETKINQKALIAKVNGKWQYVFCYNISNGLIIMPLSPRFRKKALYGVDALKVFQNKFSNIEFNLEEVVRNETN